MAGAFVPSASSTSTAELYRPDGALICAPWTIWRAAISISLAMATPSARASSGVCARAIRSRSGLYDGPSGIDATISAKISALREEMQHTMEAGAGIYRVRASIAAAADKIADIQ